jgi:hypothetical protein
MIVTVSALRQNIYNLLDQVIATGIPIKVKRKGADIVIQAEKKRDVSKRGDSREIVKYIRSHNHATAKAKGLDPNKSIKELYHEMLDADEKYKEYAN